jgi:hypothetical protein
MESWSPYDTARLDLHVERLVVHHRLYDLLLLEIDVIEAPGIRRLMAPREVPASANVARSDVAAEISRGSNRLFRHQRIDNAFA